MWLGHQNWHISLYKCIAKGSSYISFTPTSSTPWSSWRGPPCSPHPQPACRAPCPPSWRRAWHHRWWPRWQQQQWDRPCYSWQCGHPNPQTEHHLEMKIMLGNKQQWQDLPIILLSLPVTTLVPLTPLVNSMLPTAVASAPWKKFDHKEHRF